MSLEVIDFTAAWCGPCKMQKPIIEELAGKYTDVKFSVVDVDENQEMARQYSIHAIPTIVILSNGELVSSFVGLTSKEKMETEIEKYL
ncbi:Thioredoxin [Methanimicrococcus hongohii]|uniref:Thioredoxin n=1 Tax=Methanimicrococcus hongohii TaxID=3028295 RepID=A0AA96VAG0_9EURY|nr:thioredoxin family protein [Methanimicrococcus sp. Hf6]WNY24466.1 Thioredoxin [Methanimicrococcus sp. Hf6]